MLYDRNTNHLVEADSLACNRTFIDYWEPISGPMPMHTASSSGGKPRIAPSIPMDTLDAKGNRVTHTGLTPMSGMTAVAPDLHSDVEDAAPEPKLPEYESDYRSVNGQNTLEFTPVEPASSNGTGTHAVKNAAAAKSRANILTRAARPPQKPIVLGMGRDRLILLGAIVILLATVIGGSVWLAMRNSAANQPVVVPTATLAPQPSPTGFGDPTSTVPPAPTATALPVPPAGTIGINGWVKPTSNVKLRDAPTTGGKALLTLTTDQTAHVVDGPVDANGYTWWKVDHYDPSDPTAAGWCAGEFLTATEPPTP